MSDRAAYWQRLLEEWSRSGLSQAEFCRRRGVKAVTFAWWKRRLGQTGSKGRGPGPRRTRTGFVEVALRQSHVSRDGQLIRRGWALGPTGSPRRSGHCVSNLYMAHGWGAVKVLGRGCWWLAAGVAEWWILAVEKQCRPVGAYGWCVALSRGLRRRATGFRPVGACCCGVVDFGSRKMVSPRWGSLVVVALAPVPAACAAGYRLSPLLGLGGWRVLG